MNPEQFEKILVLVEKAGGGASDLAVLWLSFDFIGVLVESTIWVAALICAYKVVRRLITEYSFTEELGRLVGVNASDNDGKRAIRQKVERGMRTNERAGT